MASVYFVTRGPKHVRDHLISHLQAQPYWWKRKNLKTKKEEKFLVQGNLKPIELWEYTLPEEHIPEFTHYMGYDGSGKQCHGKQLENLARGFRTMLRLIRACKLAKDDIALNLWAASKSTI